MSYSPRGKGSRQERGQAQAAAPLDAQAALAACLARAAHLSGCRAATQVPADVGDDCPR
eukprot:CAMPEP_0197940684 /NCGR_PEP_ID=MMETSP1439-20131203/121659_1 /TAXON_ID=66791 /ORGANISM="Gonyaulax spinifera, Strain CCMP409" /LENGTH=58 /DNA_ID=CAMNT_0043563863 /DNA_START=25 /DNA_END=196 /DNA_ORIENTATION=-